MPRTAANRLDAPVEREHVPRPAVGQRGRHGRQKKSKLDVQLDKTTMAALQRPEPLALTLKLFRPDIPLEAGRHGLKKARLALAREFRRLRGGDAFVGLRFMVSLWGYGGCSQEGLTGGMGSLCSLS